MAPARAEQFAGSWATSGPEGCVVDAALVLVVPPAAVPTVPAEPQPASTASATTPAPALAPNRRSLGLPTNSA
jgi:hypothetical protein